VMAALAIIISSDSSDEKTPVVSPVASLVKTTIVAPPTGLRDLIPYSDSDFDSPDDRASPKSKVASRRSSSPTTSTAEIPTAPIPPAPSTDIILLVDAPLGIHRRQAILI
ncbi:hypothetical protein Tco_1496068, partial [Tanacetum coccineum]